MATETEEEGEIEEDLTAYDYIDVIPKGKAAWLSEWFILTGSVDEWTRMQAEFVFIREAYAIAKWNLRLGIKNADILRIVGGEEKVLRLMQMWHDLEYLRDEEEFVGGGEIINPRMKEEYYTRMDAQATKWDRLILDRREWQGFIAELKHGYSLLAGELKAFAEGVLKKLPVINNAASYYMTKMEMETPEKAAKLREEYAIEE